MFGTTQITQAFEALRVARALDTWREAAAADLAAQPSAIAA
jgi:hypothetical protein